MQNVLMQSSPTVKDALMALHQQLEQQPQGSRIASITAVQEMTISKGIVGPGQQPTASIQYHCIAVVDMPEVETVDPMAVAEARLAREVNVLSLAIEFWGKSISQLEKSKFAQLQVSDDAKRWLSELSESLSAGQRRMEEIAVELVQQLSALRETLLEICANKGGA